jgi:hypothetical protein
MKRNIFLLLAILGFIAPYYFFLQVPVENGFDLPLLLQPLFANNLLRGVAVDLTVSVIVFWVFVFVEANRLQMKTSLGLFAGDTAGRAFLCSALPRSTGCTTGDGAHPYGR